MTTCLSQLRVWGCMFDGGWGRKQPRQTFIVVTTKIPMELPAEADGKTFASMVTGISNPLTWKNIWIVVLFVNLLFFFFYILESTGCPASPDLQRLTRSSLPRWLTWRCVVRSLEPSSTWRNISANRVVQPTGQGWRSKVIEWAWRSIQVRIDKGDLAEHSANCNQWQTWWQFLTFTPLRIHKRVRSGREIGAFP